MTIRVTLLPALLLVYCTGVCTSQVCDVAVVTTSQLRNEIRSQLNETITQNLNCNCNCNSTHPSPCPLSSYDTVECVTDIVKVAFNNAVKDLLMDLTNLLVPVVANTSGNNASKLISDPVANSTTFAIPECGGDGWTQVAFLNMSSPNQTCPGEWSHFQQDSVTACSRKQSTSGSCSSANFSSNEYSYSQVCSKIVAYQYGSPDGGLGNFYQHVPGNEINEPFVDGVSVTYGNPRQHIWTLFCTVYETYCCISLAIKNIASLNFIGKNYFCDTSNPNNTRWTATIFPDHLLWDGIANCPNNSTCCAPSAGPWFHVHLNTTTTDDIEVRLCGDQGTDDEDTPVELVEIYVK